MSCSGFYNGEWAMRFRLSLLLTLAGIIAVAAQTPAALSIHPDVAHDTSAPLAQMLTAYHPTPPPVPDAAAAIEQTQLGSAPALALSASFDGLGDGFTGPQGTARFRNPSDN